MAGTPKRCAIGVAAVVALMASIAGCGVPNDEMPRAIPREAVPPPAAVAPATTTSTTVNEDDPTTQTEELFLVSTTQGPDGTVDRLVPVTFEVTTPADPADLPLTVIRALVAVAPGDIAEPGVRNPIPTDTRVLSARLGGDGVLEVDLSANLLDIEGAQQRLAVAQIVFTATDLTAVPVLSVRFAIDGQPVAVPTEAGTSATGQAVTRADYPRLAEQVVAAAGVG